MKPSETMWNTPLNTPGSRYASAALESPLMDHDAIGEAHLATSHDTPMREDAFVLTDEEKMDLIEGHFAKIMDILGLDLNDDSLAGTPRRVAKMYVQEIFSGLNPANKPDARMFDNAYGYRQMLVEKDITFYSNCEHHFVPIFGRAHVAYLSQGKVVGLSKLNRLVQFYARRPQVQERLTIQIARELQQALGTADVAVLLEATHMCVCSRGVNDSNSSTITAEYTGRFLHEAPLRSEFLRYLGK